MSAALSNKPQSFTPEAQRLFDHLMERVPLRYRHFTLASLQPCSNLRVTIERQQQVYEHVREQLRVRPEASFRFYGPAGTGKTALMAAMFRREAAQQAFARFVPGYQRVPTRKLFWLDLGDWSERMVAYNFGNSPAVPMSGTLRAIPTELKWSQYGAAPILFLDEFDKVRIGKDGESPAVMVLNAFIRAAYDNGCRIIFTTNLNREEFALRLSAHIDRRLDADGKALHFDLFKGAK